MAQLFSAKIDEWVRKVKGAEKAIFLESVDELVGRLNRLTPTDTGFLRASLVASTTAMPTLNRKKPDGTSFTVDANQIEAVIGNSEIGDVIFLGYTAEYSGYVHFGAQGRQPRPWVQMAAQQWSEIVAVKAAEVKNRLGL